MMEPISIIVGALVAGASSALKDTASQAIKDAYQGLKYLVIEHWKSNIKDDVIAQSRAEMLLEELESDPEVFKKPLEKKLKEIIPEPETALIEQAQQLCNLLKNEENSYSKYNVTMGDHNQGIQVGDSNKQENTFNKI